MMNRQLWNSFIEQIDAQVEGDFVLLAEQYETVTGHPFKVTSYVGSDVLFSMLEQAMKTQQKELLTLTTQFITQLPLELRRQFQVFWCRRVYRGKSLLEQSEVSNMRGRR